MAIWQLTHFFVFDYITVNIYIINFTSGSWTNCEAPALPKSLLEAPVQKKTPSSKPEEAQPTFESS